MTSIIEDERVLTFTILWLMDWAWHYLASGNASNVSELICLVIGTIFLYRFSRSYRVALALGLMYRVLKFLERAPKIWDSDWWCIQIDTLLAFALVTHVNLDQAATCIRTMFAFFYFAAGFWKINASFFDPATSCSSVFFLQLYAAYLQPFVKFSSVKLIAMAAPTITLILELWVGIMMMIHIIFPHRGRKIACLSAFFLHLAICLTPPPNDISPFALKCAVRLIFFTQARPINKWSYIRSFLLGATMLFSLLTFFFLFPNQPKRWALPLYLLAAAYISFLLFPDKKISSKTKPNPKILQICSALIAYTYAFLTIILGFAEQGTPNMFANLQIHGGSNHFLFPTGLLFHARIWPYSHGVVRIEYTNSYTMNSIYPADMTTYLQPPSSIHLLQTIAPGNSGPVYFNPGFTRVLGLPAPQNSQQFIRYTLPAIELQRLFQEALIADADFNITYTILPGTSGNEHWRVSAQKERISLSVHDHFISSCFLQFAQRACTTSDLAHLTDHIPWFVRKLSLYHPYPIIDLPKEEEKERSSSFDHIRCFGP
mmetsp:Transcript_4713/g.7103  ORF Transcript_4713/g.7103 Transcript_4713/m.7103 type:complete len:543 (+) Transcript_4713:205-1833(+)